MKLGPRSFAAVIGALALLAPTQALAADHPGPGSRPQLLARSGHGAAAVEALGSKLPDAAATNRMSPSRLAGILENDHTAWVGPDGQLFYKEPAAVLTSSGDTTPVAAAATYPASQTFALHSNANSAHKIFLDFDGATVSNTWWNTSQGMPSRFYSGFTLDSDPTTFTAAELTYIQQVWQIVAEKYAPFDVDVTTQDPGPDGYNRTSSLDPTWGDHVIITDDSGAVTSACGGTCSGVALVGTFSAVTSTQDYLQPAWVFSSMTSGSAVLTAHTVAHEVGHTLGLHHDGDATHAYSDGHANWFPIMGSSARAIGQFSDGEYSGANNTEDDLAIIAANGAPLRADDRSDVLALAEALVPNTLADGVISTRNDKDVFVVSHDCAATFTARATGIGAGASLDISLTVLDAGGNVLATNDPTSGQNTLVWPAVPTGMDASVTISNAPAGLYYLRIDGVGKGDPATDGYSDYASLGTYQVAASACDGSLPAPTTSIGGSTGTATPTAGSVGAPSAPGVGRATSGRSGGPVTATVRWNAPASNGGAAIVGYRVRAEQVRGSGRVVKVVNSRMVAASGRALTLRLPKGHYRFRVVAFNQAGSSPYSAASRTVTAR